MRASVIAAVAIQALGCLAWLLLENFEYSASRYLAWASVPIGSAVAAILAPPPKLVVGTFLALPAVALFPALNLIHEWLGRESEYTGFSGALWIAALTLPLSLILGLFGSGFGTTLAWLLARSSNRRPPQQTRVR
jgi:hypothetical protein